MSDEEFEKHRGEIAETRFRLGSWQPGHQVIILRRLTNETDPLVEVESRGRLGSCHFSELRLLGEFFDV